MTSPSKVNPRFFPISISSPSTSSNFEAAESNFIDAAIAQKTKPGSNDEECKELEPFPFDDEPDELEEGDENSADAEPLELEMNTAAKEGGWNAEDMLATNEAKYGYKSTYNSALPEYTLAVERGEGVSEEEYRRRELEAERIAAEIESSTAYKRNIDKELSDNEEEEEAFSAVVRTTASEINNNNQTTVNNNSNNSSHYNYQGKSGGDNNSKFGQRRSFGNNPGATRGGGVMQRTSSGTGSQLNSSTGYKQSGRYQGNKTTGMDRQSSLNNSSATFNRRSGGANSMDKDPSFSSAQNQSNKRFNSKYPYHQQSSSPQSSQHQSSCCFLVSMGGFDYFFKFGSI